MDWIVYVVGVELINLNDGFGCCVSLLYVKLCGQVGEVGRDCYFRCYECDLVSCVRFICFCVGWVVEEFGCDYVGWCEQSMQFSFYIIGNCFGYVDFIVCVELFIGMQVVVV